MFEFIISLVVLIGGGYMVAMGTGTELGVSAVTAVITFWFSRRQVEQLTKSNNVSDQNNSSPSGERNGK